MLPSVRVAMSRVPASEDRAAVFQGVGGEFVHDHREGGGGRFADAHPLHGDTDAPAERPRSS
jgi:hypothetical protein